MLLLDNSAWARLASDRLPDERAEQIADQLVEGTLAICLPFLLEAGYSARSGDDHGRLMRDLSLLPAVAVDEEVARLAVEAQGALARVGHHRVPPADLVIAACAHHGGTGVLHYDRDYDLIAECTDLTFESVWLAPAGSI